MIIFRKDPFNFNEWFKFKDCKLSYIVIYKFSEHVQFCTYHFENSTHNSMQLYIHSSYLLHCYVPMWLLQLIRRTFTLQVLSTYSLPSPTATNFSLMIFKRETTTTPTLWRASSLTCKKSGKTKFTTNRSE